MTVEEFVKRLEKHAWENKEDGTLSVRHAHRIVSGELGHERLRPATIRLIEGYLCRPIEELLSVPDQPVSELSQGGKRGKARSGSLLATARRRMGYTQEEFAETLGVEFSTVGRWERGQHSPQVWMRPKIACALKMSTEEVTEMLEPSLPDVEDGFQKESKISVYWSNTIFADGGVTEVGGDRDMPVNRRSFLSIAAVAAVDVAVADEFTASIAGGDAEPLTQVQTTYEVDMAVASVVDNGVKNTLMRWSENQGNPVARVNATGILAKMPDQSESARVVKILKNDNEVRRLYLTAVTMRVCSVGWQEAAQFIENPIEFALAPIAVERFMREVINPKDIGARWCAAKMLQELSPVIGKVR